jgi:tRNA A37 threonylcarbamoyladenosine dehydratase
MDVVAASNINRQLPAMTSTLGMEKIEVMAEQLYFHQSKIKINLIDDYLTPENVKELLAGAPDLILDCIDDVKAKLALMLRMLTSIKFR